MSRLETLRERPRLLVAGVVVAVLLVAAIQAVAGPDPHLSAYGDDPQDLGQARRTVLQTGYASGHTLTSPHLLTSVPNPDRYLFVVAGVEEEYRKAEVDAIESFVRDGGNLILADDFGSGDAVASRFGVGFTQLVLRDDQFRGNRSFVQVNATLGPRDTKNRTLLTNVPTTLSLSPQADGVVMARTTPNAYVDNNGNGREDEADTGGPFPVAYRAEAGEGNVVFLSDPGMLTNQAFDADDVDNRAFFRDLVVGLLPSAGTVIFDESRHPAPLGMGMPVGVAGVVVTGTQDPLLGALTFGAVAGSLALAALLLRSPPAFGLHRQALDRVRPPETDAGDRGQRLRSLALQRVARVHNLRGPREEVLPQAVEAAEDPALRRLLEAEDPRVGEEEGRDLLRRVDVYGTEAEPEREEVAA